MVARAEISFEVGLAGEVVDSVEDFGWGYFISNNFHHYIKNLDSPVSKHNKLLVNDYGDLRSEGYLYPCASQAAFDSRTLSR